MNVVHSLMLFGCHCLFLGDVYGCCLLLVGIRRLLFIIEACFLEVTINFSDRSA